VKAILMVCIALFSAAAAAHDGGPGGGPPYVPPPVEPIPPGPAATHVAHQYEHEVWLVDQSNTNGLAYGGTIHIFDGEDLRRNAATARAEVVDLAGATATLCMASTGANPVRPHMLVFNERDTHAALAFVASGHVVIFDARRRQPLACFRTEPGVGGVRQAHAVWPTPDSRYLLVANQNGKKFERIRTDYHRNVFVQDPAATIDLAGCTTPSGQPCEAPELRPDNAPICPFVPESGYPAYVSLRGGGMLALNPYSTPMKIVAEYAAGVIPRDGCGFVEAGGYVYGNGGGGNVAHPDGWFIYRLPVGGPFVYHPWNPPNTPAPREISHDLSAPRDAHGVAKVGDERYVWFFDRAANVVEIYHARSGAYVKTENIVSPYSADPTPDLAGEAPDGKTVYVSLRGPNPLSGDPHASTGSTPGVMVIEVRRDGRDMVVRGLAPISNVDAGGVQRADAHGIRVRRTHRHH
jgi:hypothetical protein